MHEPHDAGERQSDGGIHTPSGWCGGGSKTKDMCDTRASVGMNRLKEALMRGLKWPQSSDSDAEELARRWRWQEAGEGKRNEALPRVPWGNLKQMGTNLPPRLTEQRRRKKKTTEFSRNRKIWSVLEAGEERQLRQMMNSKPFRGCGEQLLLAQPDQREKDKHPLHLFFPPKKEPVEKERKSW